MYINRTLEKKIREVSKYFPVIMVTGARQVGKTTMLKNMNKNMNYVNLDHPNIRTLAKEDPELFLQQYKAPLIIDEVQYAPELFPYIKMMVDNNNQSGQYYLTGSQAFPLMKNVTESLAGRVCILTLNQLSRAEIYGYEEVYFTPDNISVSHTNIDVNDLFERIYRGAMPKMILENELSAEDYYSSYVQTYIERDIRNLENIGDEEKFLKFLRVLAARTGTELNLSEISKEAGINSKTVDRWISLLVTSGIVYLLNPYSKNIIKRIVKRPKIYFMDTGLVCYLTFWNNSKALSISSMAGQLFETYVITEIIKTYTNNGLDPKSRLCYYRDNNKKEIDLLVLENDTIYPIEIKKSASPKRDAIKNFTVLDSFEEKRGKGVVVSLSSTIIPMDKENIILPLSFI